MTIRASFRKDPGKWNVPAHYSACLRDERGKIVWVCIHHHRTPWKTWFHQIPAMTCAVAAKKAWKYLEEQGART